MMHPTQAAMTNDAETRQLCALLEDEAEQYAILLALAMEQEHCMEHHDVPALAENAQRWQQSLPPADAVRIQRERCAAALLATVASRPTSLTAALPALPPTARRELAPRLTRVRRAALALARQNELNRRLAAFCLDLVAEEASLFRRGVLEDPAGCYDGEARPTQSGPGGVLVRQA